jgi:hypothetical protein
MAISIAPDESVLLMHFIDTIFALQFPMYQPSIQEGGRGWLLGLLLATKPFYHAALALSSHHRRTVVLAEMSHSRQVAALVQQENNLQVCMKLLSQLAQDSCPRNGLGVLISVIQLGFYEVFTHSATST